MINVEAHAAHCRVASMILTRTINTMIRRYKNHQYYDKKIHEKDDLGPHDLFPKKQKKKHRVRVRFIQIRGVFRHPSCQLCATAKLSTVSWSQENVCFRLRYIYLLLYSTGICPWTRNVKNRCRTKKHDNCLGRPPKTLELFSERRSTPTQRRKQKLSGDGWIRLKQVFAAACFMSSENN